MTIDLANLIESARQGNGKSIAALINQSLQSQGISAQAAFQEGYLKVMLEGETTPDQEVLVPYIQQGVTSLNIPNLQTLQVFGRIKGTKQPAWTQILSLQAEEGESNSENAPIEDSNQHSPQDPAQSPAQSQPSNPAPAEVKASSSQAEAITQHLNQAIGTDSITLLAELNETSLNITVKTDQLLEGDTFSKSIREVLLSFNLTGIDSVQVYKQKTRGNSRYKIKEFTLVQEASSTPEPEETSPPELSQSTHRPPTRMRPVVAPVDAPPPKRSNPLARLIPIAILTVIFLFITFRDLTSIAPSAAEQCKASSMERNRCVLAVQIAGEQTIADARKKAIASTEFTQQESTKACHQFAALHFKEETEDEEQNPNQQPLEQIESRPQEVFRGISLLEVQLADRQAPDKPVWRAACVVKHGQGTFRVVGFDTIPIDFPAQAYQGHQQKEAVSRSLQIHQIFIVLGGNILFTAAGLFLANLFNLGIRIFSLPVLFQSAAVLGMVETIVFMIFRPGLFMTIPSSTVALFITSLIIRELEIDWSSGYQTVWFGVGVVVVTRTILTWLSLGLLFSML